MPGAMRSRRRRNRRSTQTNRNVKTNTPAIQANAARFIQFSDGAGERPVAIAVPVENDMAGVGFSGVAARGIAVPTVREKVARAGKLSAHIGSAAPIAGAACRRGHFVRLKTLTALLGDAGMSSHATSKSQSPCRQAGESRLRNSHCASRMMTAMTAARHVVSSSHSKH